LRESRAGVYAFGMRGLLLVVALSAAACGGAPTEADCSKALDHLIELEIQNAGGSKGLSEEMRADLAKQKAAVSDGQRARFMEACVKKTPKDLVDCTISAQSIEQAAKCDEK
jgi:hypothetical protein